MSAAETLTTVVTELAEKAAELARTMPDVAEMEDEIRRLQEDRDAAYTDAADAESRAERLGAELAELQAAGIPLVDVPLLLELARAAAPLRQDLIVQVSTPTWLRISQPAATGDPHLVDL